MDRIHIAFLTLCTLLLCIPSYGDEVPSQTGIVISDFGGRFLFTYGTWDGKAKMENGVALLTGFNNQGGAGFNVHLDLKKEIDETPAIRVKVGAENQAEALRVMLRDIQGRAGTWRFSLKGVAPGHATLITALDGASLAEPNELEKGGERPDLTQIAQIQIQGDWAGGKVVDLELEEVLLVKVNSLIQAARDAKVARLAQEVELKRHEQIDRKKLYGSRNAKSPSVEEIYAVAPDFLAISIQAGRVLPGTLIPYQPLPGDVKQEEKLANGEVNSVNLLRGGKLVGWLTSPKWDWLTTIEGFEGDPLLEFVADDVSTYSIISLNDPSYTHATRPVAVYRKSIANDWAQGPSKLPVRHTLYLRLNHALTVGKQYTIKFGELNTKVAESQFIFDPVALRSEAIHVQQIGYRPDDPLKHAFVSCWLGTGGALTLPDKIKFSVVDDATGKAVFDGESELRWPADKPERLQTDRNFNATDVVRLDFSTLTAVGRYRVVVKGVGSSYPFEIGRDVWTHAFWVQMKGLYNQRSGMALGSPYSDFTKPRDMFPGDGYLVTKSSVRQVDSGEPSDLVKGDTGEKVDGWGGYHDAGDWNPRRVTHMKVTMAQLEVFELFPSFFSTLELNIPKSAGVPDVLTEAVWEFSCFRRLQNADGGVPYQIESRADPSSGEVSWLNRLPSYVNAPDYASSWYYAAVGARLSRLLMKFDPKSAADFRESALRAMAFAEKDYRAAQAQGKKAAWEAMDTRNLAAVELYETTGDKQWHEVFLQDSVLTQNKVDLFKWGETVQRDAAFTYARLPSELGDAVLKKKAIAALAELAERGLKYAEGNVFGITSTDPGKPQFLGFYSTSIDMDLARAHYLTNDPRFLAGLLQSTQFSAGCNPNNVVYTSGLGANPVKHPFKIDSRHTGQSSPIGLTVYGNIDFERWGGQQWIAWPITYNLGAIMAPHPLSWPANEAFFDVYMYPAMLEFTVDTWAPNVFNWGYLAARGPFVQAKESTP